MALSALRLKASSSICGRTPARLYSTISEASSKKLLLYGANTPNGKKPAIFLEELKAAYGLEYEKYKIELSKNVQKEPWYIKLNHNGRIPTLVDGRRNGFTVFESMAILLYLGQHYDRERKFSFDPISQPNDYSEVVQWMSWAHGGLGPMSGQASHFRLAAPEKLPYAINRYTDETKRLYGVLEIRLGESERDWLAGPGKGTYSIADMNAWPWVAGHTYVGIENLDAWPTLQKWFNRISERPEVQAGLQSLSVPLARYYPGKYPRPKPGTSERPPYRAPDPLVDNPIATVTSLPEDDLTFIHRPPPTAPSPLSYTTNPVSPLLQSRKPLTEAPLPPLLRPSAGKEPLPRVSDSVVDKIRQLRLSNPEKYTRGRLAKQFGVTQHFVALIAATKKSKRKQLVAARETIHAASREKWSEKKKLVEDIRKKRRSFW
ncbi:Glutathione S-transferase 2 [Paramarasmius palmivorus]|uniref:Glutathione S-transferase 2 n=1 Tax=Paramarasmius palmivorus TaxID=297713 RepID=A0AAW0DZH6_9AGAR